MIREWKDAVRRGSIDELQRLVLSGADVDARDQHGQSALMLAATHGQAQLVEWLVARGAALDQTAKYGLSALMLAVVNGHVDVVRTSCARVPTSACAAAEPPGSPARLHWSLPVHVTIMRWSTS